MEKGDILTAEEAAEILRLNEQTVREYLKHSKMKGFQVGSHWRIKQKDLDEFIEQRMNTNFEKKDLKASDENSTIKISKYQLDKDYTNSKIDQFKFYDTVYKPKHWKEMLIKFTTIILDCVNDYEKVLKIQGRTMNYFSKDSGELRRPELIINTDIYVETNLNTNTIIKICKVMTDIFGFDWDKVKIKCK